MPHVDRECCLCDVVYCISSPVPNLELKPRFGEGSCVLGSKWAQETKPHSFFFFKKLFIYFWLCWVSVAACSLSLVAESAATLQLSPGHRLLIAGASLVAARGL